MKNLSLINVKDVSSFIGHGYFREHPGVISDIAITIKRNAAPGSKYRPLKHVYGNFWALEKGYPKKVETSSQ